MSVPRKLTQTGTAARTAGGSVPSATVARPTWDPLIRLSHWSVAAAVLANGFFTKAGGALHVGLGWAVLAILALRFGWGLWGPIEARFASFPPAPRAAIAHLHGLARRHPPREHPSHNPAGAMMVYALWGGLLIVCLTGLWLTDARTPMQIAADQAAVLSGDWSALVQTAAADDTGAGSDIRKVVKTVHELAVNLILIFAAVHVAGVAVESRALKRNLVRPMLWRRADKDKSRGPKA
ncbi:cytochrome b [Rhodobacter sp. JA431]|uniref:cytochrome b/b6 domain-containing protein n=1 Tax=Rhodobacter sp. JA431 TaxID=570013 RepID=UPI000BC5E8B9|nr:cytochrome b/b6 domain-containing protein [Rhodobacter sp. JA431]SOC21446.1 cytochrome b [Rhodobacter sp. JA431]